MCSEKLYFDEKLSKKLQDGEFNTHSLIPQTDPDRLKFSSVFEKMKSDQVFNAKLLNLGLKQSRGVAAVMGMAIADALGASTEFESFNKKGLGIVK